MVPRYKVIADWPGNGEGGHKVGTVFNLVPTDVMHPFFGQLDKYPHLFKPLAWWEERHVMDMPKFIVDKENKAIMYEVKQWHSDGCTFYSNADKKAEIFYNNQVVGEHFIPATPEEYTHYISTIKK